MHWGFLIEKITLHPENPPLTGGHFGENKPYYERNPGTCIDRAWGEPSKIRISKDFGLGTPSLLFYVCLIGLNLFQVSRPLFCRYSSANTGDQC